MPSPEKKSALILEPDGFTWIDRPLLAAMARPRDPEELLWLRESGIEVLVSLTESRPRKDWIDESGLLVFHESVVDMEPPSQDQLDKLVSAIGKAHESKMGVAVHCGAGLGRTGTVVAAFLVSSGTASTDAINHVRELRPGSIETPEQEEAVHFFARRHKGEATPPTESE